MECIGVIETKKNSEWEVCDIDIYVIQIIWIISTHNAYFVSSPIIIDIIFIITSIVIWCWTITAKLFIHQPTHVNPFHQTLELK